MTLTAALYYALFVSAVWLSGNLAADGDYWRAAGLLAVAALLLALRGVLIADDEGEG